MDIQHAYNIWADQYDSNSNRTRDLEATALRQTLEQNEFANVLEIGCGTGKNSEWFVSKADNVTAVDFSEEMLNKAKAKITSQNINLVQADITTPWNFSNEKFDLITFSLVLEHIKDIDFIFSQVKEKSAAGGYVYVGELHPFKQYSGSFARFEMEGERVELECFVHHISEFVRAATKHGFSFVSLNEWFDDDDKTSIPRILTLMFRQVNVALL